MLMLRCVPLLQGRAMATAIAGGGEGQAAVAQGGCWSLVGCWLIRWHSLPVFWRAGSRLPVRRLHALYKAPSKALYKALYKALPECQLLLIRPQRVTSGSKVLANMCTIVALQPVNSQAGWLLLSNRARISQKAPLHICSYVQVLDHSSQHVASQACIACCCLPVYILQPLRRRFVLVAQQPKPGVRLSQWPCLRTRKVA